MSADLAVRFRALWDSLAPIGRADEVGGYLRFSWSPADLACREWFTEEALDRDLEVEEDGNGNLWATWLPEGVDDGDKAIVTGSHLDSVPHGGAYDGPLGVVSGLMAVDVMRERGVTPAKPVRIAVFTEEEGSRFGIACLGSRLMTGAIEAQQALELQDRDGTTLGEVMDHAGFTSERVGPDPDRLAGIESFVELHIEQGRALSVPVGIASAIWPHGRWRIDFAGEGNHAGTTRMDDRHDPMLTFAYTVLAANKQARLAGAHATIGRGAAAPNATNAIASTVTAWLDARAADEGTLADLVSAIHAKAAERADRDGTTVALTAESLSGETAFDAELIATLQRVLPDAAVLPTGAGHDAGVLAARVPAVMLFVRNPTGLSHAPGESATDEDCAAGIVALADVLTELSGAA